MLCLNLPTDISGLSICFQSIITLCEVHLSNYIIMFDSCSLILFYFIFLTAVLQPVLLFAGASKAHALQVFRSYPVLPHYFTVISPEYWKTAFCSN